jgi:hypothetical protein
VIDQQTPGKDRQQMIDESYLVLLNNYFGRQFNSLNDVAIHPKNKDVYFTDTIYGYVQDFRPAPGLQDQVYRLNPETGAVTVVADGFVHPNGKSCEVFSLINRTMLTYVARFYILARWRVRICHRYWHQLWLLWNELYASRFDVCINKNPSSSSIETQEETS